MLHSCSTNLPSLNVGFFFSRRRWRLFFLISFLSLKRWVELIFFFKIFDILFFPPKLTVCISVGIQFHFTIYHFLFSLSLIRKEQFLWKRNFSVEGVPSSKIVGSAVAQCAYLCLLIKFHFSISWMHHPSPPTYQHSLPPG